jgi:isopenicillin N synthase-like dioxygenase
LAIQPVSFRLAQRDFASFADAVGRSFERYGFAIVEHHGIDPALIERALADTKAFFALPEPARRRYVVQGAAGQRGYTPFGVEAAKGAAHADLKAFWHVGREPGDRGEGLSPNVWPTEVETFRASIGGLYDGFDALSRTLLSAIAVHLGLGRGFFDGATAGGDCILRLLHYPPVAGDGPAIRAGAHEDINAITLLLGAEEPGLQLLDRDGRWLAVDPVPGAVVVNIGDMLQRLTNHQLPSTTHRVVNPAPERRGVARYSMPFFVHFSPDYLIRTLPGCVSARTPDRYPEPITTRAYLAERLQEIGLA